MKFSRNQPGVILVMLRMISLSILLVFLNSLNLKAEDIPEPNKVQKIEVDLDQPSSWPKPLKQWKAVNREEAEKLLNYLESTKAEKEKAWISEIEYSAKVVNGQIKDGRFQALVARQSDKTEFLSLSPMNFSINNLQWENRKAIYGSTPDGKVYLKTENDDHNLTGNWTARSNKQLDQTSYSLTLFPSNLSTIRLRTSADEIVTSDQGIISKKKVSDEEAEWEILLGQESKVHFRIHQKQESKNNQSLLIAEVNNYYIAQQDGFQFQSQLNLNFTGPFQNTIEFDIPSDFQVSSVTWGNDYPLNWKSSYHDNLTRITLILPDEVKGQIRPILIKGNAPLLSGIEQKLYSFVPNGSKIRQNQIHLTVQSPLELNSLSHEGFRQTDISVLRNNDEVYHFDQMVSPAELKISIRQPELTIQTQILTHLSVSYEQTRVKSELVLLPVSGNTFSTEYLLDYRWKVTSIRSGNNIHSVLDWTIRKFSTEYQSLLINFREPLSTDRPQSVIIELEDISHTSDNAFQFPIIKPLASNSVEQAVSLRLTAESNPNLPNETTLQPVSPDDFPDFVLNSQLWSEVDESSETFTEKTYYYYSEKLQNRELISTTDPLPYTSATGSVICQIDQERIIENYSFRIHSTESTSSPVLIYFNQPGSALDWSYEGLSRTTIQAERIPESRLIEYNVPTDGELWKISFVSPVEGDFLLKTNREQTFTGETVGLSLATVLNSKTFEGLISVFEDSFETLEINSSGASEVNAIPASFTIAENPLLSGKKVKRWSYQTPEDQITLRKRSTSFQDRILQFADLELQSIIQSSTTNGNLHTATITFPKSRAQSTLDFSLPEDAQLVSIHLNEEVIRKNQVNDSTWRISDLNVVERPVIRIHYKTFSTGDQVTSHQVVPVPSIQGITLKQFVWIINLPENWNIEEFTKGLFLESTPRSLRWTERLFGPLGRSNTRQFFNPFKWESWKNLPVTETEEISVNQRKKLSSSPGTRTWVIRSGTGMTLPTHLYVQSWNQNLITRLAWLGMVIVFLAGIHIRAREYPYRRITGYLWYSVMSAVCILSAPWIAYPTGGMLCGSILAILIPRNLLRKQPPEQEPEEIPMGSTISYQKISGTLVVLIGLFLPEFLTAQNPFRTETGNTESSIEQQEDSNSVIPILVPHNPDSESDQSPIYFRVSDYQQLLSLMKNRSPDFLIRSGSYDCTVRNNSISLITARYEIDVNTKPESIAIEIPLTHVALGGDHPCLINGKDYPVSLSEDGSRFLIVIDPKEFSTQNETEQFSSITAELSFFPLISESNNFKYYDIRIPVLTSSTIKIAYPDDQQSRFMVTNNSYRKISSFQNQTEFADLSGQNQILIINQNEFNIDQFKTEADCNITDNVFIHPSYLEYSYHVEYSKLSSPFQTLRWTLPKGMYVGNISGNHEFDYFVRHDRGRTVVLFNFRTPVRDDLKIDANCFQPTSVNEDILEIPARSLHDSSGDNNITVKNHYLGISHAPGTEAVVVDLQNLPAARVMQSEITELYEQNQIDPSSRIVLSIESSTDIPIRFTSQRESKTADIRYEFTVLPKEISTRYDIDLQINDDSLPVFQHELKINRRLNVTSVTVKEDQANRLLRWTKDRNRITLFLNNRTKGIQEVSIQGSIKYNPNRNISLPDISLKNTEIEDRKVMISQAQNLQEQVRLVSSGQPDPISDSSNINSGTVYYKVLSPGEKLPEIQVMTSEFEPDVRSLTWIDKLPTSGNTCDVTSLVYFQSGDIPLSTLDFQILQNPSISDLKVESTSSSLNLSPAKNNAVTVFVVPNHSDQHDVLIRISYKLNITNGQSSVLARLILPDYEKQIHYFSQQENSSFEVSIPESRNVKSISTVPFVEYLDHTTTDKFYYEFNDFETLSLIKQDESPNYNNRVLLSDSRVWITPQQALQGNTILIFYSSKNEFRLNWPENLTLSSLTVNGIQQSLPEIRNQQISIPIAPLKTHQTILLNWSSKEVSPEHVIQLENQQFPKPVSLPVGKNLISLIPSKNMHVLPSTGISHSSRTDHLLDWAEETYKTYLRASSSSTFPYESWDMFFKKYTQFVKNSSDSQNSPVRVNLDTASVKKMLSLYEEMKELNRSVYERQGYYSEDSTSALYFTGFEWTSELPANAIFGEIPITDTGDQIQFWCVSKNMINTFLAVLFCSVSLFFSKQIFAFHIGDKLINRSGYCWAITGLFFWLCLKFSFPGLCLTLVGIYILVQQEIAIRKNKPKTATIL